MTRHPIRLLSASCALALLLGCGSGKAPEPAPQPQQQAEADAGDATAAADAEASATKPEFPTLRLSTIDGEEYDLLERRGKWVIVNFWATWCSPCLKEMPELSALDAMREHIGVIGLAFEEISAADMQAFLRKHPVTYPVAIIDA